ncbi:MAG: putative peptidoglycan-binding domain-containing protein [Mycobacteriales bacterium]
MADFAEAFRNTMLHEDRSMTGVVTNEPPIMAKDVDIASPTFGQQIVVQRPKARFGINSHAHPDAEIDGFYEMEKAAAIDYAKKVYRYDYWNKILGDSIEDQNVANKFFDLAVNDGVKQAARIIQRALCGIGRNVVVDGAPGPNTAAAINASDPGMLLTAIRDYGRWFYALIYERSPERYTKQEYKSWLDRLDA